MIERFIFSYFSWILMMFWLNQMLLMGLIKSFVLFSQTKLWIYRILSAIVAVPLTILWAVIFSLLSVLYVWVIRPIIRIVELFLAVFKRVRTVQR